MITCLNCDHEFEGNFCNVCGQKAATHRFSMHEWLHEIPHSLFHLDAGFFKTIRKLITENGVAIRAYLAGRRKYLFSPFLFLLLMCGIYVVFNGVFGPPPKVTADPTNFVEVQEYLADKYYKVFIVALVLPVSVGSYFAYYRSGFNFAEHLVLNAYLTGQLVIGDIMITAAEAALPPHLTMFAKLLELFVKFPYWFLLYWRFFQPKKWYWGILQFILSQIISGLTMFALQSAGALLLLKLKFGG